MGESAPEKSMKRVFLIRTETGDEGTFGKLTIDNFKCFTVELPWRNNEKGKSCIPSGIYIFRWSKSPKHGECFEADQSDNAPGRTDIQIHSANWAGNVDRGYISQLEGCVSLGRAIAMIEIPGGGKKQKGVTASKDATRAFEAIMGKEPFELEIKWDESVKL